MRELTSAHKVRTLMDRMGRDSRGPGRVFFTGGASAVLMDWRTTTLDVDMYLEPEPPGLFAALPRIKDDLFINVELAAPHQFIPELPGWRERSPFIDRSGEVDFHHYDFYSQALAKIERGHARDLPDVEAMHRCHLIVLPELWLHFEELQPAMIRYPALDPESFGIKVLGFLARHGWKPDPGKKNP